MICADQVWSAGRQSGHTAWMARKHTPPGRRHTRSRQPARPAAQVADPRPAHEVAGDKPSPAQPLLPGIPDDARRRLIDPLHGVDPLEQLQQALDLVGIDPAQGSQPDAFTGDGWRMFAQVSPAAAHLVALAVAHAQEARRLAAAQLDRPAMTKRDSQEIHDMLMRMTDQLRDRVQASMYLRRNMRPPKGADDRRPLMMDGEVVTLVQPGDDARSALVTLKLPRVIIDRLRDAVHAMAPARTMAGIAALGITMVLDLLEAEHLKHTGTGFPRKPGKVLEGGRPSRTTATTAEARPPEKGRGKRPRRPE